MNKYKIFTLVIALLSSNAFANNTTANLQASATLSPTCSIRTPPNNVILSFNSTYLQQGILRGITSTSISVTCTNNTTLSLSLLPSTTYQAGDDPSTILGTIGITPRGTLTGENPANKLAYSVYFSTAASTPADSIVIPINSANFSYTTKFSGQILGFGINNMVYSNTLLSPDIYKDTVTVNVSY